MSGRKGFTGGIVSESRCELGRLCSSSVLYLQLRKKERNEGGARLVLARDGQVEGQRCQMSRSSCVKTPGLFFLTVAE